ncbi:MAG: WbqC family protein [Saprospiraceae bacterium]|nr:WbqC family protein [Saprospiraceae bacterium]
MNLQSTVLIDNQFFPPISYFKSILQSPLQKASIKRIILEKNEHFQKGTYRNRCHIATAQGIHVLSVPLKKGKNQQQKITDVQIANDVNWQRPMWRTLQTAYGNAPFWEHYAPIFEPYFSQNVDFLFDYNSQIIHTILKILKLDKSVSISFSHTYEPIFTEGVDLRNSIKPKSDDKNHTRYAQVFEDRNGFLPNLSILDLIFCCGGKQALDYLQKP